MERYKVLLVDDEVEVIDIMEQKIHWNDLGFKVVGSATNGVKALELVEKLQPDVVLTDIKMPYMNGLQLARRLNEDYPNIYIMICTGFDEFEYAKEAVHLEIKEYMLKPINSTELSASLEDLKETLDREREEKLNVKKLFIYSLEGITGFSVVPLSIAAYMGVLFCGLSFLMIVAIVVRTLIWGDPVAGWPSMVCILFGVGGVQLLCTGILGQYLAKTYLEVKNRPVYLLKDPSKEEQRIMMMPLSQNLRRKSYGQG